MQRLWRPHTAPLWGEIPFPTRVPTLPPEEFPMAAKLDHMLVVDLESTCWEGNPPAGEEAEIIEIGVCEFQVSTRTRVRRESILIKPERSSIGEFCTKLTTLTPQQVASGISFADACAKLRKEYKSRDRTFASYGDYDRRMLERQCLARGIAYPMGPTHLNVKNLLALSHGLRHEVGMAEALNLLILRLEGTHHRGDDDAWNIAAILAELLAPRG